MRGGVWRCTPHRGALPDASWPDNLAPKSPWPASNGSLLGRRAELAAVDAALSELRAPPRRRAGVLRRGRDRQDAAARRARSARGRARRAGAGRARVGARARAAVRRLGGRAGRARRVARRRPARAARRRSAARARGGAARRSGAFPPGCRTSATARTGRCARCWRRSRSGSRSCSRSTTCTGPTTRRWSSSRTCCGGRRAAGSRSRWRFRPAPVRPLLATALATAERDGAVIEHALGALSFADAETLLGTASRRRCGARSTRPAAATRSSCSSSRASTPRAASVAAEPAGAGVPRAVARRSGAGDRRAERGGAAARAGRRGRGRSGRPRPRGGGRGIWTRPTLWTRWTSCWPARCWSAPRSRAATASGTRSCATRSTSPPPTAGGSPRTARAADALAERGGSLAARAHHLERCARPGDDEALEVLIEAGRHAAARAPGDGRGPLRRRAAADPADAGDDAAAARAARRAGAGAGRHRAAGGGARGARRRALALVGPELAPVRARLVAGCAMCENLLGRHAAAHARLLGALDELGEDGSWAAADLEVELAADALYDSDFAGVRSWAQRALQTAQSIGAAPLRRRRGRARVLRRARARPDRGGAGAARGRRRAAGRARRRRARRPARHRLLPRLRRVLLRALRRRDPPLPPRHRRLARVRPGPVRDPDDDRPRPRARGPRAPRPRRPSTPTPPSRARACGATARCSASR